MNVLDVAQRAALWWGRTYTRTAPEPDRSARRGELSADVHDQLADARARAVPERRAARSVVGRALRGTAADVTWRLGVERTPARLDWHLAHPGTVLAGLFVVLVPTTMLADAARGPVTEQLGPLVGLLATAVALLSAVAVVLPVVALTRGLLSGTVRIRRPSLATARRAALSAMCVLWAGAALWRFVPESRGWPAHVSGVSWAGFGVALLVYVGAALLSGWRTVRTIDNGKVSS